MKYNTKIKAVALRKSGFSHSEIHRKLGISKSTSSIWTRNLKIPKNSRIILERKAEIARKRGRDARSENLKQKYEAIKQSTITSLSSVKINKTLAKLLCAMLYWGEGSKSSGQVVFTNSDPAMIKSFMYLFRIGFNPIEGRLGAILHLHPYHSPTRQKDYWSKITGIKKEKISIFEKKSYGNLTRENYPGCIAIHYGSMDILHELMYYYSEFSINFGGFV